MVIIYIHVQSRILDSTSILECMVIVYKHVQSRILDSTYLATMMTQYGEPGDVFLNDFVAL